MLSVGMRYIGRKPYVKRRKAIHEERKPHILRRRGAVLGRRTPYSRGVPYIKGENIIN